MVSTDPIADMLTRIRNAINVRKNVVTMPHSKVKESVARLLESTNFVDSVKVEGEGKDKTLAITINAEHTNARITEIQRMSKPGRRYYDEAKAQKVGGELICKVY
jgi:small subunit ribosomal protein S8